MLSYLELYSYSKDAENGDFDKTFVCLRDFVNEIFTETKDSNLCRLLPYKELDDEMIVRIVAAYLLVCQKIGEDDVRTLSLFANRLLMMDVLNLDEVIEKLRVLQLCCMKRCRVLKYCFSWSDIRKEKEDFSLRMFCFNLANTEFEDDGECPVIYYENKGVAAIEGNVLRLAPMNYKEYRKNDVQPLFPVCDDISICVGRKDKLKLDSFARLVEQNKLLMFQQNNIKPSPKKILKTYDVSDSQNDILVKVLRKDMFVYARTVDPAYHVIEGYIHIPLSLYDISSEDIKMCIKVGDIIKVRLQDDDKIPFTISGTFEEYYEDTATDSLFEVMPAVYYVDYKVGRRWITENGLFVNIRDERKDAGVEAAVEEGKTLSVKILDKKFDKNGNLVINGEYELYSLNYIEDETRLEFIEKAKYSLVEEFLKWSNLDYMPETEEDNAVKIDDARYFMPMAYVFYKRANLVCLSTQQRFENLMVARMIAQMCGADEDNQFISHEMSYIYNLVRFAQGGNPKDLSLTHDESLDGNVNVEDKEKVISILSRYEEDACTYNAMGGDNDGDLIPRLNDLVDASNILINKISGQEINRIKKNIAATLGVEDMYKNNENAATYYGEENDTLEFKSSIVFPPINKKQNQMVPAECTRQKWEILKAVCGFLNSMSGGEILLGVRDDGYSCGLKDDLEYLYKNGKILEPTMDKFMLYVKLAVDNAFCDDCGIASEPKDITHARVRYVSDKNKENNEVLRIQISPYEYGVVEFRDKKALPEGMSSAYQRSSNTTAALTSETKRQLRDNKLSEKADVDIQKIIDLQKAKKDRKVVTLKGYISSSGKKDRNIEPYKILLDRKAVICYDVDKKQPREYKITRFEEVVRTNRNWKYYREKYENLRVDLFDMLEGDEPAINIVLKLSSLPYNLLLEECSGAEQHIRENTDNDKTDYPWILDTDVYNICGIGRFFIGLAYDIKIVKGEELKSYVREYIEKIQL